MMREQIGLDAAVPHPNWLVFRIFGDNCLGEETLGRNRLDIGDHVAMARSNNSVPAHDLTGKRGGK